MSAAMTGEALLHHRVRRARLKPAIAADLREWREDAGCLPIATLFDPLEETISLLKGLESMIALNFKGIQADAVLCMVGTAQKQVAAALAALDKHSSQLAAG